MLKLSPASLDDALVHLEFRGDTDILPPAFELEAIRHSWDRVRKDLAGQDLDTWAVRPSRRCLSPKRNLAFRIATQLDPLDTLIVTALLIEMGDELEKSRIPIDDNRVHSYRFTRTSDGSLYDSSHNFDSFRERSLELADTGTCEFVLMADIADFFQRIYLHPLENALRVSAGPFQDHARVVKKLISGWNQSVSYGIPVGPSAFRLMAEITIADVDQALLAEGYEFCRFSDDYRIFCRDERQAREACAFLANTLLRNHGLTLQESKTEVLPAEVFLERFRLTEEAAAKAALVERFEALRQQLAEVEEARFQEQVEESPEDFWLAYESVDLYTEIDYEDLSDSQKAIVDSLNLWDVLRSQFDPGSKLDVPLTKFALQRIRQLGLQDPSAVLLSNMADGYNVFPELMQALAVQHANEPDKRMVLGDGLLDLFDDPYVGHLEYHRAWILEVFKDPSWNHLDRLMQLHGVYGDAFTRPAIVRAIGAAEGVHWIRTRKQDVANLPPWERRAFLRGAACLPSDEKKHWFRSIQPQLDQLELAVADWTRAAP